MQYIVRYVRLTQSVKFIFKYFPGWQKLFRLREMQPLRLHAHVHVIALGKAVTLYLLNVVVISSLKSAIEVITRTRNRAYYGSSNMPVLLLVVEVVVTRQEITITTPID